MGMVKLWFAGSELLMLGWMVLAVEIQYHNVGGAHHEAQSNWSCIWRTCTYVCVLLERQGHSPEQHYGAHCASKSGQQLT